MQSPGPESWHPSPEFLFQRGAGPLLDLGPYYFSALATVFGPASRVAAVGRQALTSRVIGSGPKAGTTFAVEVPTHVGALVEYNFPVALLALAATVALVPGGSGHRDRPWDLIASLQAMVALVGLVYAIQEATKPGPMPLAIVLALLAAAAGCWRFVRRQRRQAYPLIDFSLFRVVPGLALAGVGLGIVMVAGSAAIISGAPPQRAGMASSIESVAYELGSLAGVTVLGTILTAVYTTTIHLPATAPAQAAGSIDEARAAAGHLPAGEARTLLDAAASAFDNGYTVALAITAIALAAGSAFTYRYLKRQPATSAEAGPRSLTAELRHHHPHRTGALRC